MYNIIGRPFQALPVDIEHAVTCPVPQTLPVAVDLHPYDLENTSQNPEHRSLQRSGQKEIIRARESSRTSEYYAMIRR